MEPISNGWLKQLGDLLSDRVASADGGIVTLPISQLAAGWGMPSHEVARLIEDAANLAGLAAATIGDEIDIMTAEQALGLLERGVAVDEIVRGQPPVARSNRPSTFQARRALRAGRTRGRNSRALRFT